MFTWWNDGAISATILQGIHLQNTAEIKENSLSHPIWFVNLFDQNVLN